MVGGGGGGVRCGATARKKSGQHFLERGSNSFITEGVQYFPGGGPNCFQGWVQMLSIETHITCDFPGQGSGPPIPPLDPHMGSPGATVCLPNHGLSKFK